MTDPDPDHTAKPCPTCGTDEHLAPLRVDQLGVLRCSGVKVVCVKCGKEGPATMYLTSAIREWNAL